MLALLGGLTSCHSGLQGNAHLLVGATLIRPGQPALPNSAIEISGERISAIYEGTAYPHDEPVTNLQGRYVMAGMTDSLSEMSTQCEANEALRHGITSVVGTAGLDRGPINLDLSPSPVVYPMALIQSRRYGVVFTNDQLEQQLDAAPSNSDGIRFVDFNKDMNNEQMQYLLGRLHDRKGTKINAELASADYRNATGVQALLHTEWYFDPLAPDTVRALPNLQTNAAPLLNSYLAMDLGATEVTTYSSYLSSNFTLIPALGLYSFHNFPSFASFTAYYDSNNVCGIPMTRMSEAAFDNYATSGWADALYNLERVNSRNHPRTSQRAPLRVSEHCLDSPCSTIWTHSSTSSASQTAKRSLPPPQTSRRPTGYIRLARLSPVSTPISSCSMRIRSRICKRCDDPYEMSGSEVLISICRRQHRRSFGQLAAQWKLQPTDATPPTLCSGVPDGSLLSK